MTTSKEIGQHAGCGGTVVYTTNGSTFGSRRCLKCGADGQYGRLSPDTVEEVAARTPKVTPTRAICDECGGHFEIDETGSVCNMSDRAICFSCLDREREIGMYSAGIPGSRLPNARPSFGEMESTILTLKNALAQAAAGFATLANNTTNAEMEKFAVANFRAAKNAMKEIS